LRGTAEFSHVIFYHVNIGWSRHLCWKQRNCRLPVFHRARQEKGLDKNLVCHSEKWALLIFLWSTSGIFKIV